MEIFNKLPIELLNKMMLYNSHPVADVFKNEMRLRMSRMCDREIDGIIRQIRRIERDDTNNRYLLKYHEELIDAQCERDAIEHVNIFNMKTFSMA